MKNVKVLFSVVTLVVCSSATAFGDVTDTKNLTINATVSAMAKLSLDAAAVSFANADPDAVPSIASSPASVSITAKAKSGSASTVTLTVQSDDDLKSGSDTIAIGNVTWSSATGAGWNANGTMNKTVPQTVASWTGSGSRVGTNSYFLANSWNYATGTYSATTTYTLTSP